MCAPCSELPSNISTVIETVSLFDQSTRSINTQLARIDFKIGKFISTTSEGSLIPASLQSANFGSMSLNIQPKSPFYGTAMSLEKRG